MNSNSYKKKKNNPTLIMIITIIVLLFALLGFLFLMIFSKQSKQKNYDENMSLGDKYLEKMDYENAILAYTDAINIDRKQPQAYISLSQIYVENKDYEAAKEVLQAAPVEEMKESHKQKIEIQISFVEEEEQKSESEIEQEEPIVQEVNEPTVEEAYQEFLKQPENKDCYYKIVNLAPDKTPVLLIATTINISWEFQDGQTLRVHDTTVRDEGWKTQTGAEFNKIQTHMGESLTVEEDGCTAESCDIYYYKDGNIIHQQGESARYIYDVVMNEERLIMPERGVAYIYTLENNELKLEELATLRVETPTYDLNKDETILFQKNKAVNNSYDDYYAYVKNDLVPKYGLANIETKEAITTSWKDNWLEPGGIVSASVYDMDRDNEDELLVLYYVLNNEYSGEEVEYSLHAEVYEMVEGQVRLMDSQILFPYNYKKKNSYAGDIRCATNTQSLDYLYLNWYESEDATRLIIEFTRNTVVWADGWMQNYWTMQYKNGKLYTDLSYTQTAGGSSGFKYTGYRLDENGNVLSENLLYAEEEMINGRYPTQEDKNASIESFFSENGIQVTAPQNYSSILANQDKAIPIYQSVIDVEIMNNDFNNRKVQCKFTAEDSTNLREKIS